MKPISPVSLPLRRLRQEAGKPVLSLSCTHNLPSDTHPYIIAYYESLAAAAVAYCDTVHLHAPPGAVHRPTHLRITISAEAEKDILHVTRTVTCIHGVERATRLFREDFSSVSGQRLRIRLARK